MAASYTAELAYSFRRVTPVFDVVDLTESTAAQSAVLSNVEALLVDAANAFRQRRYDDAIDSYNKARRLLWTQLYPLTTFDEAVAAKTDLLRSLVSYGAEWLNVLPVEQAAAGVRPRELVTSSAPVVGLLSPETDANGTAALADLELSHTLEELGNDAAARVFSERAIHNAPDLIKQVEALNGSGTAPAAPPSGGAPTPAPNPPVVTRPLPPTIPVRAATASAAVGFSPAIAANAIVATRPAISAITAISVAPVVVPPKLTAEQRIYAVEVGGTLQKVAWGNGDAPAVDQLLTTVYNPRKTAAQLPDTLIAPKTPADAAVSVAHAWYYETPLGLAECYHALGNYSQAEVWYVKAAQYAYINATIEAPYVWSHLAQLYLDWGNSLFREGDAAEALPIYENVLATDGNAFSAPTTGSLYTENGLAAPAADANTLIGALANPDTVDVSPAIAAVILDVYAQLAKINGGLDFWGHWANNVPIWSFDYLQSVAVNFCQLAIGAERDAMTFWEKADSGQLTRTQLTQNIGLSQAERTAAQQQVTASADEAAAYGAALNAAQLRAQDATNNANEYATKSSEWVMHQGLQTQLSGGDDGNGDQLNQLADQMMSGSYSLTGSRGTLAAAESLTAARLQRDYEIDSMRRQATELQAAQTQAQDELKAANARTAAAQAAANAAEVRVTEAKQLLQAFDEQRFTPDVWNALGDRMQALSDRYLGWALEVAKRMQAAYNFENDTDETVIRPDYTASEVHGLLASDALMADIQSFTYDLVTSTAPKSQPVKQTISLAQRYPFLFETKLRQTGTVEFQTELDDFDSVYPGTYAGRIEHVEVAVDGIIPSRGISGSLTNTGISQYRTPSASGGAVKQRVQNSETQILSDFDVRADALVDRPDQRQLGIFEGAGLASTWTLALPPDVNELDFNTLTDVRLTFTYRAKFDPQLRATVLADLSSRPSVDQRQRPFPLRWVFADAFFSFYSTGTLAFSLSPSDFATTETKPVLTDLSLVVATTPTAKASGIALQVAAPGSAAPVEVTTGADGTVPSADLAAAVTGQSAIGAYTIVVPSADNLGWITNGVLDLDPIDNIALVVGYHFTPRD
jgi:hypothetical protein